MRTRSFGCMARRVGETEKRQLVTRRCTGAKKSLTPDLDRLSRRTIGAAIEVHRCLGPGLLEAAYEAAMAVELELRGLRVERQVFVPLHYKGVLITSARIDLLVEGTVVLELKAVEKIHPIHRAQVISYLRILHLRLGLLLNFNVPILSDGIQRVVSQ